MVCGKRGHVLCDPLHSVSSAAAKGLDLGRARDLDPRKPLTFSDAELEPGKHESSIHSSSPASHASAAERERERERESKRDVYCPYCACKGHNANFSQASESRSMPRQESKSRDQHICQGDLSRRILSREGKTSSQSVLSWRRAKRKKADNNFDKYRKIDDNKTEKRLPPAPILTVPGRSSQKIGRFSSQAAQLNHRSVETVASGRKRGRDDEESTESSSWSSSNGDVDDDVEYMSRNFVTAAGDPRDKKHNNNSKKKKKKNKNKKKKGKRKSDELNP